MTKIEWKYNKYDNRLQQIVWQWHPVWFDLFRPRDINSKSKARIEGTIENKSCSNTWVELKTVF